jgi:hypothetical protein
LYTTAALRFAPDIIGYGSVFLASRLHAQPIATPNKDQTLLQFFDVDPIAVANFCEEVFDHLRRIPADGATPTIVVVTPAPPKRRRCFGAPCRNDEDRDEVPS